MLLGKGFLFDCVLLGEIIILKLGLFIILILTLWKYFIIIKMIIKNILLVVTGSVAITKFKKLHEFLSLDFNVKVVASDFVSKNKWLDKTIKTEKENKNINSYPQHIELAEWSDQIIVVPATMNTIAKFNACISDNFILNILHASKQKIIFVPAMNTLMYEKLKEQKIIENLQHLGHIFIGPVYGSLKEKGSGMGRMVEPQEIYLKIRNFLKPNDSKVVVSYGASKVAIDPMRYITNKSSGLFGKLIINELKLNGFKAIGIDICDKTNHEVYQEVKDIDPDYYISAGAFSDYDVKQYSFDKIHKNTIDNIELKNNIDVLEKLAVTDIKIIGFKLDENVENAIKKIKKLNLFGMIWNDLQSLNSDKIVNGKIFINKREISLENITKTEVAKLLVKNIT